MEHRETVTVDAEGFYRLLAAACRFIMKVETGRAVSTETYHQLQDAVEVLEKYSLTEKNAEG